MVGLVPNREEIAKVVLGIDIRSFDVNYAGCVVSVKGLETSV